MTVNSMVNKIAWGLCTSDLGTQSDRLVEEGPFLPPNFVAIKENASAEIKHVVNHRNS